LAESATDKCVKSRVNADPSTLLRVTPRLVERTRLPRVTGYLLFGLICGPYVANIITRPMARELQIVNGLAVTLIAFVAGLEMNVRRLAPRFPTVLRLVSVRSSVTSIRGLRSEVRYTMMPFLTA
jgi:Kef-type K+ transport system membrane component KefB